MKTVNGIKFKQDRTRGLTHYWDLPEDKIGEQTARWILNALTFTASEAILEGNALAAKYTYSTFLDSQNHILYAQTEERHNFYESVPDYTFVGLGKWDKV